MFVPFIATLVLILLATAYMANNSMVSDAASVKLAFEKAKFTFNVEEMLKTATDSLCQNDPDTCKTNYDATTDSIKITLSDIDPYLPAGFVNDNLVGGTFGDIYITDNNSTIKISETVPNDVDRNVYLHHYRGLKYSIPPSCESGNANAFPPCDSSSVFHNYPTDPETRTALQ